MADILIKNMEMPKACEYCPIYDDDYCQCRLEPTFEAHWSRDNHCPLVELPPHGDLIDRDKIKLKKDPVLNWYVVGELLKEMPVIVEASNGNNN